MRPPRHSFARDKAAADGKPDEIALVLELKLAHQILAVLLDRSTTDKQPLSDLLAREALSAQLEYFTLPVR